MDLIRNINVNTLGSIASPIYMVDTGERNMVWASIEGNLTKADENGNVNDVYLCKCVRMCF